MSKIIKILLDIILPTYCISCKERGDLICDKCLSCLKTTKIQQENDIFSCFDYQNESIKKLIWDLKYHKQFNIGKKLGKILYEELLEEISELESYTKGQRILVIPVPLFKKRQIERGYNQSEIIAKEFANMNTNIFELRNDLILKILNTEQQAKILDKSKRLQNIKNAFYLQKSEIIKNRTIITIDDVTTTGGTLIEIKKILKKAKAKKVLCFTVAH
jgi:competence protein ComFC